MMHLITRLMLQNFKKFPDWDVSFSADRNVSDRGTVLLALDRVLSDIGRWGWHPSRHLQARTILAERTAHNVWQCETVCAVALTDDGIHSAFSHT
jgi:hypothetical protein